MEVFWFSVIVFMLAMYAVLDGFDLGAGMVQLVLTRSESDRRSVLAAALPFWDGNEFWLLLAGGALYCAFPAVFRSQAFSTGAVVLLWLLILRGAAVEFRRRVISPFSRHALDITYSISGLLLAVVLGAAVGCVIRGVPPTSGSRMLYWFPALCGLCSLATLTLQSAAWLALKTSGELQTRCRNLASVAWWVVLLCYAGVTAAGFAIQPHLIENLQAYSWISAFAVITLVGLIGGRLCMSVFFDLGTFASSSCLVVGLLASAAAGQFPYLLNSAGKGLSVYRAASLHVPVSLGLIWWALPFLIAIGYNIATHRALRTKLSPQSSLSPVHAPPAMTAGD